VASPWKMDGDTQSDPRDSPAERRFTRFGLWFMAIFLPALVVVSIGMLATSANGHVKTGWADALGLVAGVMVVGGAFTWTYRLWTLRRSWRRLSPSDESGLPHD
jgi:hypothetical protein